MATGPLFFNSRTDAPIHKSTDFRLIRAVMDEADPGKFSRVHNCLVSGFDPPEIIRRTFWHSSSIFIDRFSSVRGGFHCVALNT